MPRVLISGASGLFGSALARSLAAQAYEICRLVRRPAENSQEREYHPDQPIAPSLVSGMHLVIHLAGENVAGRWTGSKKSRIRESRVLSTRHLSRALGLAAEKPRMFLCASAIGFYGDRGDETLSEASSSHPGFLAEVCREWEAATHPASEAGIPTINLRIGVVLSPKGGALKAMLAPFRLGLGGRIGSGRQWWSWIHLADLVGAVLHIIQSGGPTGPVNLTAPEPVRNRQFTADLAESLRRPALLPVPAWLAQAGFGEFAREGLLASARVLPQKLLDDGFRFQFPELTRALKDLLP